MGLAAADLLQELKTLRKGFGIEDPGAVKRAGPAIRLVSGVTDDDGPAEQRRKIRSQLLALSEILPDSLARASRQALALDGGGDVRLESRLRRMAAELGCDPRTIRNQVDEALRCLAEEAMAMPSAELQPRRDVPWHLERLTALVLVESCGIEVIEQRHIVSHQDGLQHIVHGYSVPPASDGMTSPSPAKLQVDVLSGGLRESCERWSATRAGMFVRLPRPLDRNQSHHLTIRATLDGWSLPFYVCTPRYPCARFELTVRFGQPAAPRGICLVENEFPMEVADPSIERELVELDQAGEAKVSFVELEPNRSYGLSWTLVGE